MSAAALIEAVALATAYADIPPDSDGMNDDRSEWAGRAVCAFERDRSGFAVRAVDAFAEATNMRSAGEDDASIITDLLADLMHWADRQYVSFGAAFAKAKEEYAVDNPEMSGNADGEDSATVLADLLRNLELLCYRSGIAYDNLVSSALIQYEAETQNDEA